MLLKIVNRNCSYLNLVVVLVVCKYGALVNVTGVLSKFHPDLVIFVYINANS